MSTYLPVIGLLTAAAITPGPNNFIVMETATRRGLLAAAPAILAVVAGSLTLLVLVWFGTGTAMMALPGFNAVLSVAGAAYLIWLGAVLAMSDESKAAAPAGLPSSFFGIAAFQLANPKAWVMVITAVAAMAEIGGLPALASMMAIVAIFCLGVWALLGTALAAALARPRPRLFFNRLMGTLLIASAAGILIDGVR